MIVFTHHHDLASYATVECQFLIVNTAVWAATTLVLVAWRGNFSPLALLLNLIIAAPWSMANCTIGIVGLCGIVVGFPGASYILTCIAWCNSLLASLVLYLADSTYSGWELEGTARVSVVAVLAIGLFVATKISARRTDFLFRG